LTKGRGGAEKKRGGSKRRKFDSPKEVRGMENAKKKGTDKVGRGKTLNVDEG